jgi:hypothetical protein
LQHWHPILTRAMVERPEAERISIRVVVRDPGVGRGPVAAPPVH